jgi:hypothetical protein
MEEAQELQVDTLCDQGDQSWLIVEYLVELACLNGQTI